MRLLAQSKTTLAHVIASKTWLYGLVGTIAVTLTATTLGYFATTQEVTLSVDGKAHTVRTFGDDVGAVLAGEGITLHDRDLVVPGPDSPVHDGTRITARFSKPLFRPYFSTSIHRAIRSSGLPVRERKRISLGDRSSLPRQLPR